MFDVRLVFGIIYRRVIGIIYRRVIMWLLKLVCFVKIVEIKIVFIYVCWVNFGNDNVYVLVVLLNEVLWKGEI